MAKIHRSIAVSDEVYAKVRDFQIAMREGSHLPSLGETLSKMIANYELLMCLNDSSEGTGKRG